MYINYILTLSFIITLLYLATKYFATKTKLAVISENIKILGNTKSELEQELSANINLKNRLQNRIEEYIAESAKSEGLIESMQIKLQENSIKIRVLEQNLQKITEENYLMQQEVELKKQEMSQMQKRINDWEESRKEAISHAKAAIFEAGTKLTEDLISKHRLETEESKKQLTENAQSLQDQFTKIVDAVSVLNSEVKSSKDMANTVKQALLTPSGAGSLAEITLENILTASNLEKGRDFIMQYSVNANSDSNNLRLRPDCVVFLPAENILVIDSKASKFFTEIAITENPEEAKTLELKLKTTMNNHLKTLVSKEYSESVRSSITQRTTNQIITVMFLPSEIAVEKVSRIDKDFLAKAWNMNIYPVGPSGLINILANAKFLISSNKQAENYQIILEEMRKTISSVGVVYEHARKLGNSIFSAAGNFDRLAASFNSNLMPKIKNLTKLGVITGKEHNAKTLERYTMISYSGSNMIEVEVNKDDDPLE